MLCLVDDVADAGEKVMHSSTNILTSLFVRGRHLGCACWLLTQKLRVVSLICRTNFTFMLIWRLRNSKELMSILEELDALHDRRVLMQMYQIATQDKHGFWYINLLNDKEQMFSKVLNNACWSTNLYISINETDTNQKASWVHRARQPLWQRVW